MPTTKGRKPPIGTTLTRPAKRQRVDGSPTAVAQAAQVVNFANRKRILAKKLAALRKSCRNADGWDQEGYYMAEACGAIADWLPDLWSAMMEHGAQVDIVQKSIIHCCETAKAIEKCDSEADFDDIETEVDIKDKDGKLIFHSESHLDRALQWFWRELLVFSQVQGHLEPPSSTVSIALRSQTRSWLQFERNQMTLMARTDGPSGTSTGRKPCIRPQKTRCSS
ncbi:hypothetical protein BDZ89DRAFT_1160163 [Hymenopellis radicata]|nr:hypothetical protein BDZ89DRAFT_1160163 [Hymenopellis radicata]